VRGAWLTLNGEWQFAQDPGRSGRERGLSESKRLPQRIQVPFCPESSLSGIGNTDFMPAVWYRRTFMVPDQWAGMRVLLHFGAVDYDAEVWVNGCSIGRHRGGYSSFSLEITRALRPGENVVVVCAEDDTRSGLQPSGKQSQHYASQGCHYTRTTGIWQSVWLEAVPSTYLSGIRLSPDLPNGSLFIRAGMDGPSEGLTLVVEAKLDGVVAGRAEALVSAGTVQFNLSIKPGMVRPWAPGSPTLYDLKLELCDGNTILDRVDSYFGLRSLGMRGPALLLNGKPFFQRLVLDQGFYRDGIYTAPSDDALRGDIERAMAMGFNGARLHEKVFEERFLYWADTLGYLVWGEMGNWGMDHADPAATERFAAEWLEVLARDYNHPSIVGWCPFNETPRNQRPELVRFIHQLTRQFDRSRPAIDTSGWVHVGETDVYDIHDYEQNPEVFAAHYEGWPQGEAAAHEPAHANAPYAGQPVMVSEYGGIWWNPGQQDTDGWGYGNRPTSEEEFLARYRGLTEALLHNPRICGFCYTQLTDVEQEVNGLYTYDREPKFAPEAIHAINTHPAAIERGRG
jgi:beta-galactosidase/beta-glucuronidase